MADYHELALRHGKLTCDGDLCLEATGDVRLRSEAMLWAATCFIQAKQCDLASAVLVRAAAFGQMAFVDLRDGPYTKDVPSVVPYLLAYLAISGEGLSGAFRASVLRWFCDVGMASPSSAWRAISCFAAGSLVARDGRPDLARRCWERAAAVPDGELGAVSYGKMMKCLCAASLGDAAAAEAARAATP